MTTRLLLGARLSALVGVLVAAVGAAGWFARDTPLGATWLTATLGPTAYILLNRPPDVPSAVRSGLIGHATGILAGLAALAVFGLWSAPSVAEVHAESPARIGAQAAALAVTVLVLTVADAHHPPAGATALLVASGIAGPGEPLTGLALGLVVVLAGAPLFARLPTPRARRPAESRS